MASFTKLPSGKYRARVRVNGQYKGETFATKTAAKQWATQLEAQYQSRRVGMRHKTGMTLGDIVSTYQDERIDVPGVNAGKTQRDSIKLLARELETARPENIDAELQAFIVRRRKAGTGGVTLAMYLSYLSSVLKWAAAIKNLDVDESAPKRARASLELHGIRTRSKQRDRLPTDAELDLLYQHWSDMKRQKIPMERISKFALATGMRQGEICRIRIEDIDWTEKTVLIRQRKDPKHKETNDQTVPLIGDAIDLAKEQAGERKSGRLFPYNSKSVSHAWAKGTESLGIDDLKFHDLRHAATTEFFRMGLPIQLVALITGHKSWENLRRYTQLSAADVHAHLGAE